MATEPESSLHEKISEPPKDFSLVLGGPLYQLLRRSKLSDNGLHLLKRRLIVIPMLVWLPLLFLSIIQGNAWSGVAVPFIKDIELHIRFLAVMPMLIGAEMIVHQRMRRLISNFLDRQLIPEADMGRFRGAISESVSQRIQLMGWKANRSATAGAMRRKAE